MAWRITLVTDADASPERDTTEATIAHLERGGATYRVTVELASSAASAGRELDARRAVRRYLHLDEPPRHLIVTTEGVQPAR